MPTTMRSITHPAGFTRLHRTVSAVLLSLYLGAFAIWYAITDDAPAGEVAFKLAYVTSMWMIIRVMLIMPWAERSVARRPDYSVAGRPDYSWAD